MTGTSTTRLKIGALLMALTVVLSAGTAVAFTSGGTPTQASTVTEQADDESSVATAEDVQAERIEMQNVEVTDLTLQLDEIEGTEEAIQEGFASALGDNVEGFDAESIQIENIQSASITIEDDTLTVTAEIESIAIEGAEADSVTWNRSNGNVAEGMFLGGSLTFESLSIEGLSVGTLSVDVGPAEPPEEPTTEEPTTEEPTTEEPTTEEPTTEEPTTEEPTTEEPTTEEPTTEEPTTEEPTTEEPTTEEPTTEEPTTEEPTTEEPTTEEPTTEEPTTEEPTTEEPTTEEPTTEEPTTTSPVDGDNGGVNDTTTTTVDNGTDDGEMDENASVTFLNQTSNGTAVNVSSVTLPEDGYVAIHDDSLLEGNVVGSVIGVSEYLEAGTYENLTVSLFNVSGADFNETMTLDADQSLIAMPHIEDSGNETYDFVASDGLDDGPFITDGVAVTDRGFVTVEMNETADNDTAVNGNDTTVNGNDTTTVNGNDTTVDGNDTTTVAPGDGDGVDDNDTDVEETASVTFENQTSNGTAVSVASVTLPEDGYVTIHDDSLLQGEVTGSVIGVSEYLEAGTYENLTVSLFNVSGADFNETMTLDADQSLIAMPHIEDSGNETYDFVASDGLDDGPFTADGVAVTERAFVTVEMNETAANETEAAT